MSIDPVRQAAFDILVQVEQHELLDPLLERAQNSFSEPRDAMFLAELVRGTLQWQGRYDHIIRHYARKKPPTETRMLVILRLALHQLLTLDGVPAYAAIHEAGQLCRFCLSESKVGFINGLLQSVRREIIPKEYSTGSGSPLEQREERLRPLFAGLEKKPADWIAAWYSHPRWLVRRWGQNLGRDAAEAICSFNNLPVELAFHVAEPQDPEQACLLLAEAGCPVQVGNSGRTLIAVDRPHRVLLDTVLERFQFLTVQDSTVQEATSWLADVSMFDADVLPTELPVLDICAAPGGKTAFLAGCWPGENRIIAMDNRRPRLKLLNNTLARINSERVDVLLANGLEPPFLPNSFQAILLDGPCSGTGVIRRHPDGRWRLQRETPAQNSTLLLKLAEKSADLLAPGGLLMYATCSLEAEENQNVVDELLNKRDDLQPAPAPDGQWQKIWLPNSGGGDGFFAARLQKKP